VSALAEAIEPRAPEPALGRASSLAARLLRPAFAWLVLGLAMCVSATWLLIAGDGLTFVNDDDLLLRPSSWSTGRLM